MNKLTIEKGNKVNRVPRNRPNHWTECTPYASPTTSRESGRRAGSSVGKCRRWQPPRRDRPGSRRRRCASRPRNPRTTIKSIRMSKKITQMHRKRSFLQPGPWRTPPLREIDKSSKTNELAKINKLTKIH